MNATPTSPSASYGPPSPDSSYAVPLSELVPGLVACVPDCRSLIPEREDVFPEMAGPRIPWQMVRVNRALGCFRRTADNMSCRWRIG